MAEETQKVTALDTSESGQNEVRLMLDPKQLHPIEKEVLKSWGWDGTSAVPSDMAKRLANKQASDLPPITREAYNKAADATQASPELKSQIEQLKESLPDGFKLPTNDLGEIEMPPMSDDADIAETLAAFNSIAQKAAKLKESGQADNNSSAFSQALREAENEAHDETAGLDPVVAEAARRINNPNFDEVDPYDQAKAKAEEPEAKKEAEEAEEEEQTYEKVRKEITDEDQEAYRNAIMSFNLFEKTYTVAGGVELTFRDMSHEVEQMILVQEMVDRMHKRVHAQSYQQINTMGEFYQCLSSLVRIKLPNSSPEFSVPIDKSPEEYWASLNLRSFLGDTSTEILEADTDLRRWSLVAQRKWLKGSLRKIALRTYQDFSLLNQSLQYLASRPDFLTDQTS